VVAERTAHFFPDLRAEARRCRRRGGNDHWPGAYLDHSVLLTTFDSLLSTPTELYDMSAK
jgi:hypothetical protein